ncbi:MAG: NAD-dependent epimerase/dehydratase family protein [Deltaproteobacteria bacterium]|nr:NAD-dependent epimerase/dehydratase family protein [Deltaproteobacteria bacterium]
MKAFVTGATGFLGPYVVRALVAKGYAVTALARERSDTRELETTGCRLAEGDVTDPDSLGVPLKGADTVVHMASVVATRPEQRALLESVNVEGTRNVLAACREARIGRLLHVSSVAAVGAAAKINEVLNEDSPGSMCTPEFPNFDSKRRGEDLVREAARNGELDAVIVNPSMIFGAGDVRKAARRGNLMAARGKLGGYTRGGLSIVAVEDVVEGMLAAIERGRRGERYILSGENLMIRQLLAMYAECTGASPPRHEIPTWVFRAVGRAVDTFHLKGPVTYEGAVAATSFHWFDHSKARRELGFRPRPAVEAVKTSVKWMAENGYL